MGFWREKPSVLIDSWHWDADQLAKRLKGCNATEAGSVALSKITTDTVGADQIFRLSGLKTLLKGDRPPLIGLTITHPNLTGGMFSQFITEKIRRIKPLVNVVKIDRLTDDEFQSAITNNQLLLPCYPNPQNCVALPMNKFQEFAPNSLYVLQPVIVREAADRFGFLTG